MSTDTPPAGTTRRRWIKPLIVASLALNLLFVGGLAASAWRHHHGFGRWGHGPHGDFPFLSFVRELPADRQSIVRDQVMAARERLQPLRKDVRDAWDESNRVLALEPFDKGKAQEAMTRLSDAELKFKSAVYSVLLETAEKLTADERARLQKWRERRRPGTFDRRGPGGPPSEAN